MSLYYQCKHSTPNHHSVEWAVLDVKDTCKDVYIASLGDAAKFACEYTGDAGAKVVTGVLGGNHEIVESDGTQLWNIQIEYLSVVVAGCCLQDAFDQVIDYLAEYYPGLILENDEEFFLETIEEGYIEDYISGGNAGLHLATYYVAAQELSIP